MKAPELSAKRSYVSLLLRQHDFDRKQSAGAEEAPKAGTITTDR